MFVIIYYYREHEDEHEDEHAYLSKVFASYIISILK